jgi:hypothetical protein
MQTPHRKRAKFRLVYLFAIFAVVAVLVYVILTYPVTVVSFPVSFSIGANTEEKEFNTPLLHGLIQVEVTISSGTTLWSASITQQDEILWDHRATQGDQTTYQSGWIQIPGGQYNFTFSTIGFGELQAHIKVTTKGGFW